MPSFTHVSLGGVLDARIRTQATLDSAGPNSNRVRTHALPVGSAATEASADRALEQRAASVTITDPQERKPPLIDLLAAGKRGAPTIQDTGLGALVNLQRLTDTRSPVVKF
jgi:hypothetical protein